MRRILPADHVLMGVRGTCCRDLLRVLAGPLVADGVVTKMETFLDDLEQREHQITTQIGEGIAFPHARSHVVRRLGLTVGISEPPGTMFNPALETPCRLFFLIAVPSYAPVAHLPLLQKLANFSREAHRTSRLANCRTPGQAARLLVSYKG